MSVFKGVYERPRFFVVSCKPCTVNAGLQLRRHLGNSKSFTSQRSAKESVASTANKLMYRVRQRAAVCRTVHERDKDKNSDFASQWLCLLERKGAMNGSKSSLTSIGSTVEEIRDTVALGRLKIPDALVQVLRLQSLARLSGSASVGLTDISSGGPFNSRHQGPQLQTEPEAPRSALPEYDSNAPFSCDLSHSNSSRSPYSTTPTTAKPRHRPLSAHFRTLKVLIPWPKLTASAYQ